MWKNSYKKSREERINLLKEANLINKEQYEYLLNNNILSNEIADKLVENQISVFGLPFGIATNFLINGKEYVIPMAVEEPSVIAAACNAAKIIAKNGGFKASIEKRLVTGHISLYDVENIEESLKTILSIKEELIDIANKSQPNMVSLGGGARDITAEIKGEFLIIYLHVDTKDAMGANTVNTMLEVISPIVLEKVRASKLMSIISNYSTNCIVKANCEIEVEEELGIKLDKAIKFANTDVYRAVTNNKGVSNGIDAIALATGNDWRAIEAGMHSYAVRDGQYKSITNWEYRNGKIYGSIELPMAIASYGGSINVNELAKISLSILGNPNSIELAKITACVGLAQNFAAIRALVSVGIQKGHMKLHLKTLAISVGATLEEVDKISKLLENEKHIDVEIVKKALDKIRMVY